MLDDDLVLEHEQIVDQLRSASEEDKAALAKREVKLREQVRDATVTIAIQAIGGANYDYLVEQHPASADQVEKAKAKNESPPNYNLETFAPALIAASVVEPELSLEDAKQLWQDWNTGERLTLFMACVDVNSRAQRVADLGNVTGAMPAFEPSSTTAARKASRTARS